MRTHVKYLSKQRVVLAQGLPDIDVTAVLGAVLDAILGYKQFKINILVAINDLEERKAETPSS